MDSATLRTKSLELIHKTKEFLLLKKEYEESLWALGSIKKWRLVGESELGLLPGKVQLLVKTTGSLEEAEKAATVRMAELHVKMEELAPEIRKLSDQIDPYFSGMKQPEGT